MNSRFCYVVCMLGVSLLGCSTFVQYQPNWKSLDARPLPQWYDEAKIGIFIHWGVFSVPSFGNEWFWNNWKTSPPGSSIRKFMEENYRSDFTYADFAPMFTAELYDPDHWAELFAAAGAKYVVLTSKHHEGYCNWNTSYSFNWNSVAVGSNRDLVGDLAKSIRNKTDIRFGLYHSLFEWFNPLYLLDRESIWKTQHFSLGKTIPELHELVNKYQPEVIWSDGEWEAPTSYWNSTEFLAWLYNESPVKDSVVTNDRWGAGTTCQHGGYYTCADRYNPGVLQKHKWENAMTLDTGSWGYNRNSDLSSYLSLHQLLTTMAETVSCGGNILINIGPTHDGRILPIFEERLRKMGEWLKVNGEGIYSSTPWQFQNDTKTSGVWYTKGKSQSSATGYSVYAFVPDWPKDNQLVLGAPLTAKETVVSLLGYSKPLAYTQMAGSVQITFPFIPPGKISDVAWMLKFDSLKNGY